MPCIQCRKDSKYKCPICRQPYCSIICYKEHKQNPCSAPLSPTDMSNTEIREADFDYPTEDTVPLDKLKLLEQSKEIIQCLENPHVRVILEVLDKSGHPEHLIQEYMQEPIFTELVDECLKVVQPKE